jgi:hypothetical protein
MAPSSSPGFSTPRVFALTIIVAAFAGMLSWWFKAHREHDVQPERPRTASTRALPQDRHDKATPRSLVSTWRTAATAAESQQPASGAITLTSHPSPERRAAFQTLLAALTASNAGAVYDALSPTADEPGGSALTDAEWNELLAKWGRLDGREALEHVVSSSVAAHRIPGILSGWAPAEPLAAAAWIGDHEKTPGDPPPWLSSARRDLILGWLQSDFEAPARWLDTRQDDPSWASAAAAFADKAAARDPSSALAWAQMIEGPWRNWALQSVARQWYSQDPVAASTALQEAGWHPDAIRNLTTPETGGSDLLEGSLPSELTILTSAQEPGGP